MSNSLNPWPDAESSEDDRQRALAQTRLCAKAVHEGVVFRLVYITLGIIVIIGGSLDKVIPYTPAIPLVVLAASVLCFTSAARADHYARAAADPGHCVGGFLFTALIGSGVNVLFSGIAGLAAAFHAAAQAAPGNSSSVLLDLSWPAVVISLLAVALAIRVMRRIRADALRR